MEYKQQTADKIFAAAKKVFVEKGFDGARTQKIADEGGVNKALLHYYFKTKEQLFELTYGDSFNRLFETVNELLSVDLPLGEVIDGFVDGVTDFCFDNPLVPTFVFGELFGSQKYNVGNMIKKLDYPESFEGRKDVYYTMLGTVLFPFTAMPFIMSKMDFLSYVESNKAMVKNMLKFQLGVGVVEVCGGQDVEVQCVKSEDKEAKEKERLAQKAAREAEKAAREAEKEAEKRRKLQEYNLFDDPAQYKLF